MINRGALLLKYKAPAIKWIQESSTADDEPEFELDHVNEERTVYLVPDKAANDNETVRAWVELNHEALFQHELAGWVADESFWPQELSLQLFDAWFDIECHSIVIDTSDEPIIEEDYEGDVE